MEVHKLEVSKALDVAIDQLVGENVLRYTRLGTLQWHGRPHAPFKLGKIKGVRIFAWTVT